MGVELRNKLMPMVGGDGSREREESNNGIVVLFVKMKV
jgi:hypothetical protein